MRTSNKKWRKWRERVWIVVKSAIIIGLFIFIVFGLLSLMQGCAFTHRGETSVGLFKDVERSSENSSRLFIGRPARD